jgi:single-strand DNA-binding protein
MNSIRNSVMLIGNLGQDPVLTVTPNGNKVANFSLATNETYRNQEGERITATEWHRCQAWGRLAETISSYCKKGKEVALRGKLTHRSYEDKEGVRRYISEVVVNDFTLLSKKEQ